MCGSLIHDYDGFLQIHDAPIPKQGSEEFLHILGGGATAQLIEKTWLPIKTGTYNCRGVPLSRLLVPYWCLRMLPAGHPVVEIVAGGLVHVHDLLTFSNVLDQAIHKLLLK